MYSGIEFVHLPNELLFYIASLLEVPDFAALQLTCKQFRCIPPDEYLRLAPRWIETVTSNLSAPSSWHQAATKLGKKVEKLDISKWKKSSRFYKNIDCFPNLKSIKLNEEVTNRELDMIACLPHLENLFIKKKWLNTTHFDVQPIFFRMHQLKKLTLLSTSGRWGCDGSLCPNLVSLKVSPLQFCHFNEINQLSALKVLTISNNLFTDYKIPWEKIPHVLEGLEEIRLKGNLGHCSSTFESLEDASALKRLTIDYCYFEKENMRLLSKLCASLPNLETIRISLKILTYLHQTTVDDLASMKQIKEIHISQKRTYLNRSQWKSLDDRESPLYFIERLSPFIKSFGYEHVENPRKKIYINLIKGFPFHKLQKVEKFDFNACIFSKKFFESLAGNMPPQLHILSFRDTNVTDKMLKSVLIKGKFTALDFSQTKIKKKTVFKVVKYQKNLVYLNIESTAVRVKGMKELHHLKSLKGLEADQAVFDKTPAPKPVNAFKNGKKMRKIFF